MPADHDPSQLQGALIEGVSDAVGFVGGALLGFWAGQWLGWDIFRAGYGAATLGGIVLVSIGGGVGLQLARRWRLARRAGRKD